MIARIFICCLFLYSCTASRHTETRLYFGQSKLDGGIVTEIEWNQFVEKYVARVFPDGSTIESATGNWYDTASRKLVTEPSKVVIAIGKLSNRQNEMIDSLRYWYKTIHLQQSVLRVDKKVKMNLF